MRLDMIGDIHGHAEPLEALLRQIGYDKSGSAWRHPDARRAVFVGDLIDRGPAQIETVAIVRAMVDAGTALVVMGNHEFNAIAYAMPDPAAPGQHLRPRRGHNIAHHAAFLDAVGGPDTALHRDLIGFFKTMPLWLDLPGARIVHACWSPAAIAALTGHTDANARLTEAGFQTAATKGTPAYAACETLLKGPEMNLPEGVSYQDAQGSRRKRTRIRWWDAQATTLRAACVETSIQDQLSLDAVPDDSVIALDETKPIFFGHYWMQGPPIILSPRRTCLDFSIAKGGVLCAYRFDGEQDLDPAKLIWTS